MDGRRPPKEKIFQTQDGSYQDKDLFALTEGTVTTQNMELGNIKCCTDLKTMLLRHWTLFDSISNSNYLVAKLKIHSEPGQKTFKRFLAQIGVPLEQSRQKFMYMNANIRNELK